MLMVNQYRQYSPIAAAVAVAFYAASRQWLASNREAAQQQQQLIDGGEECIAPSPPPPPPPPLSLLSHNRISVGFETFPQPLYLASPVPQLAELQPLETLWLHAPGAGNTVSGGECLILLVPGAPGLGVLYADLLLRVQAAQQQPCAAQAISYPLTGARCSWAEVTQHVAAALNAAFGNPRWSRGVVILAQSMGAMFTAQALTQLLLAGENNIRTNVDAKLKGVHLITPFFDPRTSGRGAGLYTALPWIKWTGFVRGLECVLATIAWVVSPERAGRGIAVVQRMRGYGTKDPPGTSAWFFTAFAERLQYRMIYRTQKLAYEAVYEGQVGPLAEQHPDVLATLQTLSRKGRLCFHLSNNDAWTANFDSYIDLLKTSAGTGGSDGGGGNGGWAGQQQQGEGEQHSNQEPTVRSYDVKHGFPQDAAQSTVVATSIAELLNPMLLL